VGPPAECTNEDRCDEAHVLFDKLAQPAIGSLTNSHAGHAAIEEHETPLNEPTKVEIGILPGRLQNSVIQKKPPQLHPDSAQRLNVAENMVRRFDETQVSFAQLLLLRIPSPIAFHGRQTPNNPHPPPLPPKLINHGLKLANSFSVPGLP